MNLPPTWGLSLIYWFHMLATVAWVGSLVSLSILVLPAARGVLDAAASSRLIERIGRRLQGLGWFSLGILTVTGLFQMSANLNYKGFLAIANPWAVAILLKHIAVGLMVILAAYQTWEVMPQLSRAMIQQSHGVIPLEAVAGVQRKVRRLLNANLVLAAIILALTALARAS